MKKLFLFSTIAISIFALGACSNSVNKGSFKTLSYGKPLNADEATSRKEGILEELGAYSSYTATYYSKLDINNYFSETYTTTQGNVKSSSEAHYKTNTVYKSKKEGISVNYKDYSEHYFEANSDGFITETIVTPEETTKNSIASTDGHGMGYYAVKNIWTQGGFDTMISPYYSSPATYAVGRQTHFVISDVNEEHSFVTNGSETFEQKSIARTQRVIVADEFLRPIKASYYQDVKMNYDSETGSRYKSMQEVNRIYLEIKFKTSNL